MCETKFERLSAEETSERYQFLVNSADNCIQAVKNWLKHEDCKDFAQEALHYLAMFGLNTREMRALISKFSDIIDINSEAFHVGSAMSPFQVEFWSRLRNGLEPEIHNHNGTVPKTTDEILTAIRAASAEA